MQKLNTTDISEAFVYLYDGEQKKSTWDYVAYCIYTSHSAEINLYSKQMLS